MAKGLNERQRRFVEAYMGKAQGNATTAAELAGYAHPGQTGHRLLKNIEIQDAIRERVDSDPLVMSREQMLHQLSLKVQSETYEKESDWNKGFEMLAKLAGYWVEKSEQKVTTIPHEDALAELEEE